MRCNRSRFAVAGWIAGLVVSLVPVGAGAGGGPGDETSLQEHGTHFFGEAKDIKGLTPLEAVNVKIAIAGTLQYLVVVTDPEGRFRLEGFGKDVPADKVDVSCNKAGYRMIEAMRHKVSGGKDAPIEVECLLARQDT